MRSRIKSPSPALAISLLALFVAMGGTSYAAITITGKNVKNSSLTGADVKNSSLAGADVKNNSLTGSDVLESKLAKVPSAARSDVAGSASSATTAITAATAAAASNATSADVARSVGVNGVGPDAIQDGAVGAAELTDDTVTASGVGVTVPSGGVAEATVTCPNGGRAVGGGGVWVSPDVNTRLVESAPAGASTWTVRGAYLGAGSKTLRARVLCLS